MSAGRWNDLTRPPTPPSRRVEPAQIVAWVLVAVLLGWLVTEGRIPAAVLLAAAVTVASVLNLTSPRFRSLLDAIGRGAAVAVSAALLGLLFVLLLPVTVVTRLLGWNPLEAHAAHGRWRSSVAPPDRLRRRTFQRERPASSWPGRLHAVGVGVAVAVLAAGALLVVVRGPGQVVAALDERTFGLLRDQPAGPVHADTWASNGGVPVSRHSFPGEPWGADALAEVEAIGFTRPDERYGWTLTDASGEFVNVVDGVRSTTPVAEPEATVWIFGGSTAFGVGQRDQGTIASFLVEEALAHGRRLRVINRGVPAYVNAQEAQVFEDLLAEGERPDVAIFYDGCNELAVAGERLRYGHLDPSRPVRIAVSDDERAQREADAERRGHEPIDDDELLADLAARQYREGALRAQVAAERTGTDVLHVWQPTFADTSIDDVMAPTVAANLGVDASWFDEQHAVSQDALRRSGVDAVDLTDSLDDAPVPTFFEWCHSNEAGARLQAEALYPHVEALLDDR